MPLFLAPQRVRPSWATESFRTEIPMQRYTLSTNEQTTTKNDAEILVKEVSFGVIRTVLQILSSPNFNS